MFKLSTFFNICLLGLVPLELSDLSPQTKLPLESSRPLCRTTAPAKKTVLQLLGQMLGNGLDPSATDGATSQSQIKTLLGAGNRTPLSEHQAEPT